MKIKIKYTISNEISWQYFLIKNINNIVDCIPYLVLETNILLKNIISIEKLKNFPKNCIYSELNKKTSI